MRSSYFLLLAAIVITATCTNITAAETPARGKNVNSDTNRILTNVEDEERSAELSKLKSVFSKMWAKSTKVFRDKWATSNEKHKNKVMDKLLKDNNNFIRH
ncbi:Putative RxLR effector [Phytophthora palmivora]|uniref:RxLR effector n=1 Tax=Phytophthora palmivora TaxID=4796 RepID=A0A2P4XFL4_9STRA|nr:Putative RxLR effector [Phytophthora palmivora]